jgi:3-isopropylmalate dehydratase
MIAPDETTIAYLKGRPLAPTGEEWDRAVAYWRNLKSDPEAHFDKVVQISASDIDPTVSWGTSPQDVVKITGVVPDPKDASDPEKKASIERALKYMGLEAGVKMEDVKVDKVTIPLSSVVHLFDPRPNRMLRGVASG